MRPNRKIVAEFFGVFLFGSLAGGLAVWCYTDSLNSDMSYADWKISLPKPVDTTLNTFMSRTSDDPDNIVTRINKKYADDYHLSPDEVSRIQPMVMELARNLYQVRHQFGVDILGTLDKYHAEIAGQLTPEHRAAYEAAMAARRKQLSAILLPDQGSPTAGTK